MKPLLLTLITFLFCALLSCKKPNPGVTLSSDEKKLLGRWDLRKIVTEEPGQPIKTNSINSTLCFMEFFDSPAYLENRNSPIYSNTKRVEDKKDCTFLTNAWKIDNNGKLLLASIDTLYAEILFVSNDSLSLKIPAKNNPTIIKTYGLKK